MTTSADNAMVADQVKTIKAELDRAGWVVINAVGEQVTPDRVLWFTSTYTSGEYTVEASYRPTGAGRAEGVTRVRLTPSFVKHHPSIGADLARSLIGVGRLVGAEAGEGGDIRALLESEGAWPPALWAGIAR